MSMLLSILREKIVRIGRDEDGAALVVTLAVFMFMYLLCIGVYATGTAVKQRIHLQNACDAAAYSAAVVQADTLSRIATINRAMSWTYAQMTRRQMDHVTQRWLDEVVDHWEDDNEWARLWAKRSETSCGIDWHHGNDWACSDITLFRAQGSTNVPCARIKTEVAGYTDKWVGNGPTFYADPSMTGQISNDWAVVQEMGTAIDDLKENYAEHIKKTIEEVVTANCADRRLIGKIGKPFMKYEPISKYLKEMENSDDAEDRFLRFSGETVADAFSESGKVWFKRKTKNDSGFLRGYELDGRVLRATWTWRSSCWNCSPTECIGPSFCPYCKHSSHERCSCAKSKDFEKDGVWTATVYADNSKSKDDYYETPDWARARPHELLQNYFGKDGTISVGLACENENPWAPILGTISQGIFSAFKPFTKWTVCFASAKAGYKRQLGAAPSTRNYRIDWNGIEDWNLCQSDWDAVLIPVRMAKTQAENGGWGGAGRFLAGWVYEMIGNDEDIRAGGLETPEEVDDYVQAWNELKAGSPSHSHAVSAKWQIGTPNGKVNWNELTDRMFH